jgi:NADP-dependent 3-hydroxy acid dehydrogenase YdfG
MKDELVVITGAGAFIGGSLIAGFRQQGYRKIRAVDVKPLDEWYQRFDDVENLSLDLNLKENCERAARDAYQVYDFAGIAHFVGSYKKGAAPIALNPQSQFASRLPLMFLPS